MKNRTTPDGWAIDRSAGYPLAFYGSDYQGDLAGTHVRAGKRQPGKATSSRDPNQWLMPALFYDSPDSIAAGGQWFFETAVVCKSGKQKGMVYGSVSWGMDVTTGQVITARQVSSRVKPTSSFFAAVNAWNAVAANPSSGQKPLELTH